jgi:predicted amidohydrolase YtcJ
VDREGLRARGGISLATLTSVAEIVEEVRRAAARARPGEWIVTMPMGAAPHDFISRPEQLRDGRFPTRDDLDAAAPDNPVYIRAVWGWWSHRPFPSVANSMALRVAGITASTAPPYNCEILKDSQEARPAVPERTRSFEHTLLVFPLHVRGSRGKRAARHPGVSGFGTTSA